MSSIVTGRRVVKRFGDFTAVAGVDFDVQHGECFGFLGPNGAGKTSVMRMIQCLSPMTEGAITVADMTVGVDDRAIKGILGVAPQDDALDPDLSVVANLEIFARYFDIPAALAKRRAADLLQFFYLDHKKDTKIRELSGGMQRKLVIARALINEPRALILDEPTTGLDPHARREIWRKLEALKADGVTMLLTTHYMEEAIRLCDRIALMDAGKIVALGDPHSLIRERVGGYAAEIPRDAVTEERLREAVGLVAINIHVDASAYHLFTDDVVAAADKLRGVSYEPQFRPATLEDLFYTLTGGGD
jgi:lipooligosaccharide transport system ATP-binding protein